MFRAALIRLRNLIAQDERVKYGLNELWGQARVVLLIAGYIIGYVVIFFQRFISDWGSTLGGLIASIVGLTLFLHGLKAGVMPMGELLGRELNARFPLSVVLAVSFVLGVLVTIAEPAIASLRPLGGLLDVNKTAYLFYMMNDGVDGLVLAIGLGVGFAAVLGTLRFIKEWPLRKVSILAFIPTMLITLLVNFLDEDLKYIIPLAWDCGGVTTGPVTVPILLALGIGATSHRRATGQSKGDGALDGFGIITLASLFPIITVLLYGLILFAAKSRDEIVQQSKAVKVAAYDESPLREVVHSLRAIIPLVLVLVLLIKFLLKKPMPNITFQELVGPAANAEPEHKEALHTNGTDSSNWEDEEAAKPQTQMATLAVPKNTLANATDTVGSVASDHMEQASGDLVRQFASNEKNPKFSHGYIDEPVTRRDSDDLENYQEKTAKTAQQAHEDDAPVGYSRSQCIPNTIAYCKKNKMYLLALLSAQIGLIIFSYGLTYGYTHIGNEAGALLPPTYEKTADEPRSPLLPAAIGFIFVLMFVFGLGILATLGEPSLAVMALQVYKLTKGALKPNRTVWSVAVGVSMGTLLGVIRLKVGLNLVWLLLPTYFIACFLTWISDEAVINVAWDSAGVTTGPVTVPFMLAIGIAFANAANAREGFGILTLASVCPIISVLSFGLWTEYRKKKIAAVQLA